MRAEISTLFFAVSTLFLLANALDGNSVGSSNENFTETSHVRHSLLYSLLQRLLGIADDLDKCNRDFATPRFLKLTLFACC